MANNVGYIIFCFLLNSFANEMKLKKIKEETETNKQQEKKKCLLHANCSFSSQFLTENKKKKQNASELILLSPCMSK